jgi:hypothetical protein
MSDVVWTKSYNLQVDNRDFRILVSKVDDNEYYAKCLWYEKGRLLKAPNQSGSLTFHLEQRHAQSEEEVLKEITNWVNQKFGHEYNLSEIS